jgi:hypothetical protein
MQKLTLSNFTVDKDCTIASFDCDFVVTAAGDGLWGCEAGRKINVTGINIITNVYDDEAYVSVNVTHNSTWDIYTDSAFEAAISDAVGFSVRFTEQGMQDDLFASMEA